MLTVVAAFSHCHAPQVTQARRTYASRKITHTHPPYRAPRKNLTAHRTGPLSVAGGEQGAYHGWVGMRTTASATPTLCSSSIAGESR